MNIFISLAVSLAITLALEMPFALVWGLRGKNLLLAFLVNILTNPVVVLLYWIFANSSFPDAALKAVLEISAVAVEGAVYAFMGDNIKKPVLLSICANAFSFGVGLLINLLL